MFYSLRQWFRDRDNVLFFVLLVLYLVPFWSITYFPSQDGPAHLYNANIIRQYHNPATPIFREYYTINTKYETNWLGHLWMTLLIFLCPALIAEKIFLSVYMILFCFAFRYVIRVLNPESGPFVFLAFPLAGSVFLFLGFYNFLYSLVFFLLGLGYWVNRHDRLKFRQAFVLGCLILVSYLFHPLAGLGLAVILVVLTVWEVLFNFFKNRQQFRSPSELKVFFASGVSRILFLLLAILPIACLFIKYVMFNKGSSHMRLGFDYLFGDFLLMQSLISFRVWESAVVLPLSILSLIGMVFFLVRKLRRHELKYWDGFFLAFLVFFMIYLWVPDAMSGGGRVSIRLEYFCWLMLFFWLAAQTYNRWLKPTIQIVVVLCGVILWGYHAPRLLLIDDYFKEYLSCAKFIEPSKTVLPLRFGYYRSSQEGRALTLFTDPFIHTSNYLGAIQNTMVFENYEAHWDHFPVKFREPLDPFVQMAPFPDGLEAQPPLVDFLAYQYKTGKPVDYVLLWALTPELLKDKKIQKILYQLSLAYDLIYLSPQRGLLQLYRRKS